MKQKFYYEIMKANPFWSTFAIFTEYISEYPFPNNQELQAEFFKKVDKGDYRKKDEEEILEYLIELNEEAKLDNKKVC